MTNTAEAVVQEAYRNLIAAKTSRARALATCLDLAQILLPEMTETALTERLESWIRRGAEEHTAALQTGNHCAIER